MAIFFVVVLGGGVLVYLYVRRPWINKDDSVNPTLDPPTAEDVMGAFSRTLLRIRTVVKVLVALAVVVACLFSLVFYQQGQVSAAQHKANVAAIQAKTLAAQLAEAVHEQNVSRCQDGNAFRLADQMKFEHIAALIQPPPTASAEQKAATAKFVADILGLTHQQDTPIDCTRLP